MTEQRVRFLVVGAGVSGLSFAGKLKSEDYLVLERESEIGGYCRTVHQDGFVWDYSGHFFHFKHPELERELVSRMSDEVLRVEKSAKIYWDGTWIDFPFQKNIHQLPKEDFIDCLVDLRQRTESSSLDFKSMLYSKFGVSIAEKFLIPYNEKLYATDLSALDVDAMGRFFPYADENEIIANFRASDNRSYNSTFTYPRGGAIQYVHALAQQVDSSRIRLNEELLSLSLKDRVAETTQGKYRYDYLVSSMPFPRLMELASIPYSPEVYSWNKVLVFNLGFDQKGPSDIHWSYFPQKDVSFYRVGFYDNIFGDDRMSLYVEVGFDRAVELSPEVIAEYRSRVLRDLGQVGLVHGHRLLSEHHVVLDPAYVHITQSSRDEVEKKREWLKACGVYSMGRYGGWTYCSIEDNMLEARDLASMFCSLDSL